MSAINKTLTFSNTFKFNLPEFINWEKFNFCKKIGVENFNASLLMCSNKSKVDNKAILSTGVTFLNPKYITKVLKQKIKNIFNSSPLKTTSAINDSTYIDMGEFESLLNNSITWYSQDYPNGYYDTKNLNAQLDTVFKSLANDGSDEISLSFAQISNISKILNPDLKTSYSGTDKILEILAFNSQGNNPDFNKPIVQDGKKLDMDIIRYIL